MIDKKRAENAIRELLLSMGEDPDREGLKETPKRVANMYEEIFAGISQNPVDVLKYFDGDYSDEMVVVKDIPFYSMCEHHLLPFYGVAHICYIPTTGKLLGLSKLARIVDLIAKKPQLQEKMTCEIAELLKKEVSALGVLVVLEAEHLCMNMRGIKKAGSKTITTAMRGKIKSDNELRKEAISLINLK